MRHILPMLLLILASAAGLAQEAVWIEGEDASRHDFTRHGWYDGVNKSLLSGSEWLSHYDKSHPGKANIAVLSRRDAVRSSDRAT